MEVHPLKTSHSSRNTFRACKRKYHWSYIKGLEQERKPKGLRMGSVWSDALEHGGHTIDENYRQLMVSAPSWEVDQLAYERLVVNALYATYPFKNKRRREAPFVHEGENYQDRGQLDGLEVTPVGVVIEENKLFARFGNMEKEKLEFDEQIDSYVAAVCDGEVEGYESGCHPSQVQVEYNVTLKPALRLKAGEYLKELAARAVADIYARPEHYHRTFPVTRTEEQLDDFRMRRDKHAKDLEYELKMDVWERSPSACFDYGQCPFLKICRDPNAEEVPEGYRLREERK
jgi:hypothetical protein